MRPANAHDARHRQRAAHGTDVGDVEHRHVARVERACHARPEHLQRRRQERRAGGIDALAMPGEQRLRGRVERGRTGGTNAFKHSAYRRGQVRLCRHGIEQPREQRLPSARVVSPVRGHERHAVQLRLLDRLGRRTLRLKSVEHTLRRVDGRRPVDAVVPRAPRKLRRVAACVDGGWRSDRATRSVRVQGYVAR